jgi:hypothetical protein
MHFQRWQIEPRSTVLEVMRTAAATAQLLPEGDISLLLIRMQAARMSPRAD